ncbi:hypothetical protein L596_017510 [Steinernema carpocapsae]|uniref:Uncharacterized protein n=1 Tax=Steinernema carpocapsae TaxID=34508 RepID=A0A4U5N2A6_STECR|nr:hypothetical protein L596_017510 [Steinernema carpocapsae]
MSDLLIPLFLVGDPFKASPSVLVTTLQNLYGLRTLPLRIEGLLMGVARSSGKFVDWPRRSCGFRVIRP